MGFDRKEWIGNWENFELYFTDLDPAMCRAWADAEREIRERKMDLISSILFRHGAKQFWMDGCYTVTEENEAGKSLGCYIYTLDMVLPKGLESKESYLLHAENAPQDSPFAYLLSMPPMPEHAEKEKGGLISHLHFQFGRKKEQIVKSNGKLRKPHWYATLCDADATMLQRCNIVRALHKLPVWKKLPEI